MRKAFSSSPTLASRRPDTQCSAYLPISRRVVLCCPPSRECALGSADLARRTDCERASLEALLGATTNRLRTVDRSRFLTSTDESASGVQSQVAPRGAARA